MTNDPRMIVLLGETLKIWKPLEFVDAIDHANYTELSLLIDMQEALLMDEVMDLLGFSRTVVEISKRYHSEFYRAIGAVKPDKVKIAGNSIESVMSLNKTDLVELNAMRALLLQMIASDFDGRKRSLDKYLHFLEKYFSIKIKLEISNDSSGHVLLD